VRQEQQNSRAAEQQMLPGERQRLHVMFCCSAVLHLARTQARFGYNPAP
jgi:hypothetical protein